MHKPQLVLLASLAFWVMACTPRVEIAAPEKPITINLNVKIEHEIKVKVEKELDELFSDDSGLF
ncbi:YnbE family lipoprotein [Corallincola platygyrae]|uniref:YnbE family lipoprotein n=1 Tax=Corallincola platygyrae TaxID=1193278 RepID=A0ABW4XJ05_9GAMM